MRLINLPIINLQNTTLDTKNTTIYLVTLYLSYMIILISITQFLLILYILIIAQS